MKNVSEVGITNKKKTNQENLNIQSFETFLSKSQSKKPPL